MLFWQSWLYATRKDKSRCLPCLVDEPRLFLEVFALAVSIVAFFYRMARGKQSKGPVQKDNHRVITNH